MYSVIISSSGVTLAGKTTAALHWIFKVRWVKPYWQEEQATSSFTQAIHLS